MEIRQFMYVSMAAECGSFTKAAEKLFITQPALSSYISKLEEELGVRLFDRSVTPLGLTYAGEKYLAYARDILRQADGLEREIRDISNHLAGRLRLGFPSERIVYMLPLILPEFQKRYPGIRVETMTGSGKRLMEALLAGDADFILLPVWKKHRGVAQRRISEEELVLAAARGYLKEEDLLDRERKIFNWARIEKYPLITLKEGHVLRDSLDTLLRGSGKKARVLLEFHSNMLACRLAAQGLGVAVVPEITPSMLADTENLEFYHLAEHPVTWEIHALYREEAYLGKVEEEFLKMAARGLEWNKKKLLPAL